MTGTTSRPATVRERLDRLAWIWIALAPWVVVAGVVLGFVDRPRAQERVTLAAPDAGAGALFGRTPEGWTPLDLLSTDIRVQVTGAMVRTTVEQSFRNDTDAVLEATYVFPLPERAAVHAMELRVGPRRIVSVVREREEARRTYEVARDEGRKAALVESGRSGLFRTSVANLNPGETVEVVLDYVREADRDGDTFSLTVPTTYVRRFGSPPFPETSPAPGIRPATMAALRAPAGSLSAPSAHVEIRIDAGLPIEEIDSPTHVVRSRWDGNDLVVEPDGGTIRADGDVVVRWTVEPSDGPRATVHVEDRDDGRYAMVQLLPPDDLLGPDDGLPTETLFVIDVSGSMAGPSFVQAKAALRAALDRLRPGDRFDVIAFDDGVGSWSGRFESADDGTVSRARGWVDRLEIGGGTDILGALRAALDWSWSDDALPIVRRVVFLTDGGVSNEDDILTEIVARLDGVRLHAIGIGSAPNRWLMREMAGRGRGLCAFVHAGHAAEDAIDRFFRRLDRPVLSAPTVGWIGARPTEVYPERLPDLHAGEALTISARFEPGAEIEGVLLEGRTSTGPVRIEAALGRVSTVTTGVAHRWARARVDDLLGGLHRGAAEDVVRPAVVQVAVAHGLVTRYTSRVAVEDFVSSNGDAVPVEVPGALAIALPKGGTLRPLARIVGWGSLALALAAWVAVRRTSP